MSTIKPASSRSRYRSVKSSGLPHGFAWLAQLQGGDWFRQDQWLRLAPQYYRTMRLYLFVFYCLTIGYATNLAMSAPQTEWSKKWLWPVSEFVGLTVKTIEIQGHRHDSEVALKAAAQVETGMPIFTMDVQSVQERILALPGVKFASVQTLLPDTVRILVEEREPFALWQRRGERAVVDENGVVITETPDNRYSGLPFIVGIGAEKAAPALFVELERYPNLRKKIKAAVYVASRRWNLNFEDGVDVKLPEIGISEALADLHRLEREHSITQKDITTIDLRFPDRVIMRLSDEAAEKRNEILKQRFGKKTGRAA